MKILFLDVDGVLNNYDTTDRVIIDDYKSFYIGIDDSKVKLLNEIIEKTDAYIVLSSTWRLYDEHYYYLCVKFFKINPNLPQRIIGQTKYLLLGTRYDEIKAWIDKYYISEFVVLDDQFRGVLCQFGDRFVQCNEIDGLMPDDVKKCVELLK